MGKTNYCDFIWPGTFFYRIPELSHYSEISFFIFIEIGMDFL